jgi:hypothetical protein
MPCRKLSPASRPPSTRPHHSRFVAAIVAVAVALAVPVAAQKPAERLAVAKSIRCAFTTMSTGNWKSEGAIGEIKPAKLTVGFDDVDVDDGTATVLGAFGPSDIIVRLSTGTLHFVQSFREGPLYATTIFPHETAGGRLRAVHTRHEYTEVSLPGFTSRPEQYYGDCEVLK